MRVLHVTPQLPWGPAGGGGRGRDFLLCRRLVELGHEVLNISPATPGELEHERELYEAGIESWTVRSAASFPGEVVAGLAHEPRLLAAAGVTPIRTFRMRLLLPGVRPLLERAVRERRPDVVLVSHDVAACWARTLPASIPAVLTFHNLTWNWYLSRARRQRGLAALLLRAEAKRQIRDLRRQLPRFQAAIAVSLTEADELRQMTDVPVSLIPNGVDLEALRPAPEPAGNPSLVFTATLNYPPNGEGIRWFAEHVWPKLRGMLPTLTLTIVGRNPPRRVLALDRIDGISVIGPVPQIAPYFDRAHVVVVPILSGAGSSVKVVEAMAAGRALVSTSLGCEGLPHVEPDRHLLVADDPDDFATATARLLTDAPLRRKLASEARGLAERHYDWHVLGEELDAVLGSVL
jgi:glycosyltransferase involved in cell wall biosynthesis